MDYRDVRKLTFGRALVGKRLKRRSDFERAVQKLVNSNSGFSFLPRAFSLSNLKLPETDLRRIRRDSCGNAVGFDAASYYGPMPSLQFQDGRVAIQPSGDSMLLNGPDRVIHGKLRLKTLEEPLACSVWNLMHEKLHTNASIEIFACFPNHSSTLEIECRILRDSSPHEISVGVKWTRSDNDDWRIADLFRDIAIDGVKIQAEDEKNDPGMSPNNRGKNEFNVVESERLAVPRAVEKFFRRLPGPWEVAPWIDISISSSIWFTGASPCPYLKLRPRMNAVCKSWTIHYHDAFYEDGFDPFRDPIEIPPDVGEYRFPVIVYRPNSFTFHGPTLQVDVVYRRNESFLEFISNKKPATLHQYAKAAGVDLQIWQQEERFPGKQSANAGQ